VREKERGGEREREREREGERERRNALGIQVLMTRHRTSARSSNEGGRSNAPRWRWLKAGCLSSFHLCLPRPRLSRTSLRPQCGLEAASSSDASMHVSPKTAAQRELSSLYLLRGSCSHRDSANLAKSRGHSASETTVNFPRYRSSLPSSRRSKRFTRQVCLAMRAG